jgi:hypothetical protein
MSSSYADSIYMRDGSLVLHRENEDYNFVKHGLGETECGITRDEVAERYPELLTEVDEILAGKRVETHTLLR